MREGKGASAMPDLILSCDPEPDVQALPAAGLNALNDRVTGYADRVPLHVIARDDEGRVIGGISVRTSLGLLFGELPYDPPGTSRAFLRKRLA